MTNEEKVLSVLNQVGAPICDDCLALAARFSQRQTSNSICRALNYRSLIERTRRQCSTCKKFKIVNEYLTDKPSSSIEAPNDIKKMEQVSHPWYWEGNIQSVLVNWLVNQGYIIRAVADTNARSHGKDIVAVGSDGKELWVSVKGYPEKSVHTQARHWLSDALLNLTLYRDESSSVKLGLALPDSFATYLNLAPRIEWLRRAMPFTIYWVSEEGHVRVE